ncbi:ABC transporter substrate-binding protein [Rhodococcus sp. 14-2470-1a]|uniref:ABC transporter substrate-binding protein n=1 Tax=Rhodococcus sp. 14-2470-1a TaxID=2023150 RepID=UPI0015C6604D|nr:extracellular solute-binding protein [Rhodococcus sp. 14-2470-1a]
MDLRTSSSAGASTGRLRVLSHVAAASAVLLVAATGCSVLPDDDVVVLTFMQNKTEPSVIDYFDRLIDDFEAANPDILVVQNNTETTFVPSLVRGSPPDVTTRGWGYTSGQLAGKDVFSDLSTLAAADSIDERVQSLVENWDRTGTSTVPALPFSITAAGVLFNRDIFERHGVSIPTTWSEFVQACTTFQNAGVVPVYGSYKDGWTLGQGLFDYTTGGAVDVAGFFDDLYDAGADFGPDSPRTFENTFGDAVTKMDFILSNTQPNAPSRGYSEANAAFANGEAAMYLQGPWALGELAELNPELRVGSFPLPVTENPADRKVRINIDVAVSIPRQTSHPEQARRFVEFLFQPDVITTYNAQNAAFSPLRDASDQPDERIAYLQPYIDADAYYQGASGYPSPAVPINNYIQSYAFGGSGTDLLRTLDEDWRRVAVRNAERGAEK